MSIQSNYRCNVAVVGSGPVGLMTACLIKAFNIEKPLSVKVFDKREETTRDHGLYIASDGIGKIDEICNTYLLSSSRTPTETLIVKELMHLAVDWKKRAIRTSAIEDRLTMFARDRLGIQVFRGDDYQIRSDNFKQFLLSTGAHIIVGADGAKSEIRKIIGAKKLEEKPLSYLVELKYSTKPDLSTRGRLHTSVQAYKAEGWDFETASRARQSKPSKRIALHKFVNLDVHRGLLEVQNKVLKGSTEHPWTLKELEQKARADENARYIYDHIKRYFSDYEFEPDDYWDERILTFPMTLYRSSFVAKKMSNQLVILAGDASSGVVLARGVNKGLIEAALCAQAIQEYIQKIDFSQMRCPNQMKEDLPKEFVWYERVTKELYQNEKWWAEWKNFGLETSELALKCAVKPLKCLVGALRFSLVKTQNITVLIAGKIFRTTP